MAEALTVIYWDAGVDGNDVEFVLAPAGSHLETTRIWESEVSGSYTMWILDIDCCNTMSMDEEGGEGRNDPYFPRPGGSANDRPGRVSHQSDSDRPWSQNDRQPGTDDENNALWQLFTTHFFSRSARILGEGSELPRMMV